MNALLLFVALAQAADVSVQAHGRRAGDEYELTISGKVRSLPDDSIVGLRFRRIANRVDWAGRAIDTHPDDRAWGRCAYVERGKFQHRELLAAPGEVEVEFALFKPRPGEAEDAPPETLTRVLRIASVPDLLAVLKADGKRMDRALAEARTFLEDAAAGKGRAIRKRLEKARSSAQEEASSSVLSASAALVERFLADLETSIEAARAGGARALSAITGEPFSFDASRVTLEGVVEILRREKSLALVREARWVACEIARLAEAGDARAWARAEPSIDQSLRALHEPVRELRSEEMTLLLAELEMSFNLAPGVIECPPSVRPEWEKVQGNLMRSGATLEESLRRGP